MKVKRESGVIQLCLTLSDPMDCSLPGSSVCGILQARALEWGATAFSKLSTYYAPNTSGPRPHGAYLEPWLCLKSLYSSCPERLLPLNWNDPCKAPCAEPWAKCSRNVGIRNLNLKILPSLKTELRIFLVFTGKQEATPANLKPVRMRGLACEFWCRLAYQSFPDSVHSR